MANLNIYSYNLHGFNLSKSYLSYLCDVCDVIIVQEHWLLPQDLDRYNNFYFNFLEYSTSAMFNVIGKGILKCKLYDGVGCLIKKKLIRLSL